MRPAARTSSSRAARTKLSARVSNPKNLFPAYRTTVGYDSRGVQTAPYLEFNQGLLVNVARNPQIKSIADLRGQVVGIQVGNTSDLVARKLKAEGAIEDIRYYPYHGILTALDDLCAGHIGALIKLFPVVSRLVKERRDLAVIQQIPTQEKLGIAFAKTNVGLCKAVNKTLANIKESGGFDGLYQKWFGNLKRD
jgi:polar amino acid transport system substrate-binding protein